MLLRVIWSLAYATSPAASLESVRILLLMLLHHMLLFADILYALKFANEQEEAAAARKQLADLIAQRNSSSSSAAAASGTDTTATTTTAATTASAAAAAAADSADAGRGAASVDAAATAAGSATDSTPATTAAAGEQTQGERMLRQLLDASGYYSAIAVDDDVDIHVSMLASQAMFRCALCIESTQGYHARIIAIIAHNSAVIRIFRLQSIESYCAHSLVQIVIVRWMCIAIFVMLN
jgi:hypothetical protein